MPIRAVLFDFDGTLADSFAAITASTNHVRTHFGHPALSEAEVKAFVGHGLTNLLERLVPGADPATAVELYREHHATTMLAGTKLFPGVADTLAALQAQGIKLGVCSNKSVSFTKSLVEGLGLSQRFECVLGPEDVIAPKPHPAMLLEACSRLKVSVDEAIYIGDMCIDVQTARAAGMKVWLVPFGVGSASETHSADGVLRDFDELLHQFSGALPQVAAKL